jgi:hypothetical protein
VLEQRIYTGETTEFVISVGDVIEEFRVQNPGEVSLESLDATIGDEVTVSWSREDLHYFEPGELSVTGELTVGDLEAV